MSYQTPDFPSDEWTGNGLTDRDIALTLENRTRQLWAEKHLNLPLSAEDQEWTQWYNFLHDYAEEKLFKRWNGAVNLTPSTTQESLSMEYQERLKGAFDRHDPVVGAHFVCGNASMRIPLVWGGANGIYVFLLPIHPTEQRISNNSRSSKWTDFSRSQAACLDTWAKNNGWRVERIFSISPVCYLDKLDEKSVTDELLNNIWAFDGRTIIQEAVEKANTILSDPFVPPQEGRFFEPLDAGLVSPRQAQLYALFSERDPSFRFDQLKESDQKDFGDKWTRETRAACWLRQAEWIRCYDSEPDRALDNPASEMGSPINNMLVFSSLAIPLMRYYSDKAAEELPVAAVFSWQENGKLHSEAFNIRDIVQKRSQRLGRFLERVRNGDLKNKIRTASDERSKDFSRYFFKLHALTFSEAAHLCYRTPAHRGLTLAGLAALYELPSPALLNRPPAVIFDLAKLFLQTPLPQVKNNSTLTALLAELARRNEVVLGLAEVISARCRAAQDCRSAERYQGSNNVTWLLFPPDQPIIVMPESAGQPLISEQFKQAIEILCEADEESVFP